MSVMTYGPMSDPRGTGLRTWLADPDNRKKLQRTKLERRAERLGVTVEALQRPRIWAPIAERRRVYRELFQQGKTVDEIWKMYPNDADTINSVNLREKARVFDELGGLL